MIGRHQRLPLATLCLVFVAAAAQSRAQITVGTSVTRDRTSYHFDAPSSYDTTELVPHFFEQQYVLDNVWIDGTLSYTAGIRWLTRVAATPARQALATDYDTFYNPGGITWVAGTTGDARIHGLALEQRAAIGRTRGVAWSGGYRVRIDLADFLPGTRTDVRNGTLVSSRLVTTAEHTQAQFHDVFVRADVAHSLSPHWRLDASADAAPATIARLAIQLPDKYPGQTLVYRAAGVSASARVDVVHASARWPIAFYVNAGGAWHYRATQRANRRQLSAGIEIRRAVS